ncbi:hypothetical protein JCM9533A_80280 [Catenuloplanes niger JCM 9533]
MLAPAEPLLLGGGDHTAVDDQRGGRIMEDRIDSQDSHEGRIPYKCRSIRKITDFSEIPSTGLPPALIEPKRARLSYLHWGKHAR